MKMVFLSNFVAVQNEGQLSLDSMKSTNFKIDT